MWTKPENGFRLIDAKEDEMLFAADQSRYLEQIDDTHFRLLKDCPKKIIEHLRPLDDYYAFAYGFHFIVDFDTADEC